MLHDGLGNAIDIRIGAGAELNPVQRRVLNPGFGQRACEELVTTLGPDPTCSSR